MSALQYFFRRYSVKWVKERFFSPTLLSIHTIFHLETYLEGILKAFHRLKSMNSPEIILTVNNIQFLQLLNFPQLVRFKLFFWAKTHLQIERYHDELFKHEKTSDNAFALG
jgi:hypothetical protein